MCAYSSRSKDDQDSQPSYHSGKTVPGKKITGCERLHFSDTMVGCPTHE